MSQLQSDYDSPWKETINLYLEPLIEFCFPQAHKDIDWSKKPESLDTELQEIIRDAETGKRFADKLVKVWLKSGEETVVLIHIEVQSQEQKDFAERMFIYNHRLYDKYRKKIISFAILGDNNSSWKPTNYGYEYWGCESYLRFPVVKLLDYQKKWKTLEESKNPCAAIIMAHLATQATKNNPKERLKSKLNLLRRLYELNYSKNQILELFRLIEWMMVLPEELKREFQTEVRQIEEDSRMPYITEFERDAIRTGQLEKASESVIEVLETRFKVVPQQISDRLNAIKDPQNFKGLVGQAVTVASLKDFEQILAQIKAG